jgi:GDP-L-fucose synthase
VHGVSSLDVNLLNFDETLACFRRFDPQILILAAGKIGGIQANILHPTEYLVENLQIQLNAIHASHLANIPRLLFIASSSLYPAAAPQPLNVHSLWEGPLEPTLAAFGASKLLGVELVKSIRRQYKRDYITVIAANMYGPGDNFNLEKSHALQALTRKIVSAHVQNESEVFLLGDGSPRRELLNTKDFAKACLILLDKYHDELPINVGPGEEISIAQLADLIANEVGYTGKILWGSSAANGADRRFLDSNKIKSLGWHPKSSLKSGVQDFVKFYLQSENLSENR